MAVLPQEVKDLFSKVPNVYFATVNADGQPNMNVIGMKAVIDDETVYLSDQFFKKTLANVQQNQNVSILVCEGREAYQIYGTARYVNEGEEFEAQAKWVNETFEKIGLPFKAKGGCFVSVDAVYSSCAGPTAGDQLA